MMESPRRGSQETEKRKKGEQGQMIVVENRETKESND
jgi:hypothetical protein